MEPLQELRAALSERYDIEREIGAGGMATVYLARDLRHDRGVALKLLNPDLGAVLGVERFLAEIKVTANLQHPNLLPLFDSGEASGLLFYVMPYVEGESLRARLDREKQLPIDEAIRIAVAVANALDYAHSHGVIHRDLKPENILMQAGQPVIADFGIALAVSKAGGNRITQTGLSLGTPQYMSPEQATGDRVIDGRSDIYSLAAVTYEMLTGEAPHTGPTAQAIIARVLTERPRPIRSTRSAVPTHVEAALEHALEKLPADRFSTAQEFAEALQGRGPTFSTTTHGRLASTRGNWRQRVRDPLVLSLAIAAAAFLAATVTLAVRRPDAAIGRRPIRFVLSASDSVKPQDNAPWPAAISPDGGVVVYNARGMLYALRTDQLDAHPIPGTTAGSQAAFSPDGQWLLFETNKVQKVRLDGSAPITVTAGASDNGVDWTIHDEIVLGSHGTHRGLSRVSAAGGDLTEFAKPDKSKGEADYLWPIATPDGSAVVFTIWSGSLEASRLATVSIDGGAISPLDLKGIRPLAVIGRDLVYVQADGAVMAVVLDRSARRAITKPTPVHDPVAAPAANNGNSAIFVSREGALVTARGGTKGQLSWIARDGSSHPVMRDVRGFGSPRLSPDGRRIAVAILEDQKSDIWIYDVTTATLSRLSSNGAADSPDWTADGKRVVYLGLGQHERRGLWSQAADDGSPPQLLTEIPALTLSSSLAPDGRSAVYTTLMGTMELDAVRFDSARTPRPIVTQGNSYAPRFSPDGRWIAVSSDESGTTEAYVRSYPDGAARVQISAGAAAFEPAWSADGSRVYYRTGNVLMEAKLALTPTLRVLARDTVLRHADQLLPRGIATNYDVTRDGSRFLFVESSKDDYQLVVVPNWRLELEQRMSGGGPARD